MKKTIDSYVTIYDGKFDEAINNFSIVIDSMASTIKMKGIF